MTEIRSRVYRPNPEQCCEKCVFNSGRHAAWCAKGQKIERYLQWAFDRAVDEVPMAVLREALYTYLTGKSPIADLSDAQARLLEAVRAQVGPMPEEPSDSPPSNS